MPKQVKAPIGEGAALGLALDRIAKFYPDLIERFLHNPGNQDLGELSNEICTEIINKPEAKDWTGLADFVELVETRWLSKET